MYDLSRIEIQIVESSNSAVTPLAEEKGASKMYGGAWLMGGTKEAVTSGAWSTPPSSSINGPKGKNTKYATKILP